MLELKRYDLSMAKAVSEISKEESNRRYMTDEVFETEDEARSVLETLIENYEKRGALKVYPLFSDGEFVGHIEIVPLSNGKFELGYHVSEKHCNRGVASGAVKAFLPKLMRENGLTEIYGICRADNPASARVLEKSGFTFLKQATERYQGTMHLVKTYIYEL